MLQGYGMIINKTRVNIINKTNKIWDNIRLLERDLRIMREYLENMSDDSWVKSKVSDIAKNSNKLCREIGKGLENL
jgi:hypothetical protein